MDPWIVHAGDPASSVLLLRMRRRDTLGMPRLGTALVDEVASDLVEAWIQTLP